MYKKAWPGMARGIWGDPARFKEVYVSGHHLGTTELESAFVEHPAVAKAAVVGFSHEIKGEGIYADIILKDGY